MSLGAEPRRVAAGTMRPAVWISVLLAALLTVGNLALAPATKAGASLASVWIGNLPDIVYVGDSFDATLSYAFEYEYDNRAEVVSNTTDICEVSAQVHVDFLRSGTCSLTVWDPNLGPSLDQNFWVELPSGWLQLDTLVIAPDSDHQSMGFSGADLSNLVFPSGVNLSNSSFNGANLTGTDLSGVTLDGSTGSGITYDNTTLLPAGWIIANGYLIGPGGTYSDVDFSNADLSGLTFPSSTITVTSMQGVNLDGTDLSAVDLTSPELYFSYSGAPTGLPGDYYEATGFIWNLRLGCDSSNPALPCWVPPPCDPNDPTGPCFVPWTPSTVTISNIPDSAVYGDGDYGASISTDGDGSSWITSSTPLVCTVGDGNLVTYLRAGTCTLAAHVAGGFFYTGRDGDDQSFTVAAATPSAPSISNLPSSPTVGDSFTPVVTSTGDGISSVTSSAPLICSVDGSGKVSLLTAGTCRLVAHIAAGAGYSAAEGTEQSFAVSAAPPQVFQITSVPADPLAVTLGTRFDFTSLSTSGAVGPARWHVTSGTLPQGLHLNAATGVIFGRVSARRYPTGTHCTITVTAYVGQKATRRTASVQLEIDVTP